MDNQYAVYEQHRKCQDSFSQLFNAILDHGSGSKSELAEEYDKYKVWVSNTGASNGGADWELSLDFRLQEASFLKSQVIRLLESICRTIDKITSLIAGSRQPFEELIPPDGNPSLTETDSEGDTSSDSTWDVSDGSSVEAGSEVSKPKAASTGKSLTAFIATAKAQTEMAQLIESLRYTIVCLYKLPVRRPAPIDRIKVYANRDLSLYQHFDMLYLRDKFRDADEGLIHRLGKLISQRRHLLEYRVSHNARLRRQQQGQATVSTTLDASARDISGLARSTTSNQSSKGKGTVIEETESSAGDKHTKRTKATVLRLDQPIETLEELYPPSVSESVISTTSEYTENQKLCIPPRPTGENGNTLEMFECPYCGLVKHLPAGKTRAWEKHVLHDLQPYVCTFQGCDMSDHLFTSRENWYSHESQVHRAMWSCNSCQSPTNIRLSFPTQTEFLDHMEQTHDSNRDTVLQTLEAFRRPVSVVDGVCCLCKRHAANLKSHLGRHLELIALFALPRPPPPEVSGSQNVQVESGDQDMTEKTSQHTNDSSIGSGVESSGPRITATTAGDDKRESFVQPSIEKEDSPEESVDPRMAEVAKVARRFLNAVFNVVETVNSYQPGNTATELQTSDLYTGISYKYVNMLEAFASVDIHVPDRLARLETLRELPAYRTIEEARQLIDDIDVGMEQLRRRYSTGSKGAAKLSAAFVPESTAKEAEYGAVDEIVVPDEAEISLNEHGQDLSWDSIKPEFAEARRALDTNMRAEEEEEAARPNASPAPLQRVQGDSFTGDDAGGPSRPIPEREFCAEKGKEWPLIRVLDLLLVYGFSKHWQDTFDDLNISGPGFVELGGPHGDETMERRILPRLREHCVKNGSYWDESVERQAGKQLLQLVDLKTRDDPGTRTGTTPAAEEGTVSVSQLLKSGDKMENHKIVMLGGGDSGKTAIAIQFCLNYYVGQYDPTIEDSYCKQVNIDGRKCIVEVLDTTGQEEYTALRDQWIREGDGFIIAYSITSRSSFELVPKFWNEIARVFKFGEGGIRPPIMLAGNNSDRVMERELSTGEGEAMSLKLGTMFMECSAKNGINIEKMFYDVVRELRLEELVNTNPFSGEGSLPFDRGSLATSKDDADPTPSLEGTSRWDKLADSAKGRVRKLVGGRK